MAELRESILNARYCALTIVQLTPEIAGKTGLGLKLGANVFDAGECSFRVWAPHAKQVELRIVGQAERAMQRGTNGMFSLVAQARAGEKYFYSLDGGKPVPDPVSRLLPDGVHGATEIVDPERFTWSDDNWRGVALRDAIIYELHAGTFSRPGNFAGVIERLGYLRALGVTVLELMPVSAFPGNRNWGYDGVSPYSVHAGYGGPTGLKQLVDAAHGADLGVVLDVVYNHLGNEGNYLRQFGPYFTERHKTPWGDAINFDGDDSQFVREYFVENALYWLREYHLDGLRLDAVQTIYDDSLTHILAEISQRVRELSRELGRNFILIAESDANDPTLVREVAQRGYGLDALWSDDFHHAVHAALTGERGGYYQDFGGLQQIARALNEGFAFQGEHFKFWDKPRGATPAGVPLEHHVFCIQNHDQVGNRAQGERLSRLLPAGAQKLAAALLLLAPETPLLFMGEEFGETAPFQFFTSYSDPELARAVSEGRRREFKDFSWSEVPDPQDEATFARSKLHWEQASESNAMLRWYRALIALRKKYVANVSRSCRAEAIVENALRITLPAEAPRLMVIAELNAATPIDAPKGWKVQLEGAQDGYSLRILTAA